MNKKESWDIESLYLSSSFYLKDDEIKESELNSLINEFKEFEY